MSNKLSVHLPNGIVKCCNLIPILFNIFINDVSDIFDKTFCQPAKITKLILNRLLYADDHILFSESYSG